MEKELKLLGLSEKEREIYLACLRLQSAKASEIAKYSKIERQAVYYVLGLLVNKGLVSEVIKSGVVYFELVDAKLLFEKINEEKKLKEEAIRKIAQEQERLKSVSSSKMKVYLYEGKDGIESAIDEMLNLKDFEIYSFNSEKLLASMNFFLESYANKRVMSGTKLKVIADNSEFIKLQDKMKGRMIKSSSMMQDKDYGMAISKDKVIFVCSNDKTQVAFKVEDERFAELQRNLFEFVWGRI